MQTIIINQMGEHTGRYEFRIDERHSCIYIHIPGHDRDQDGPTTPDYPEQEKWMREHSGLEEIWHLIWECKTQKELEEFLQKLEAEDLKSG